MLYGCAPAAEKADLRERLIARCGAARTNRFIKAADEAGATGYVERPSDFVRGVTDLVAPIIGAYGVIATLISPYIERTPPTCAKDVALDHLRRAAATISIEMSAISQA